MRMQSPGALVRLRPRRDADYVSQDTVVLATDYRGTIESRGAVGLFVDETRVLSRLRYLVAGRTPTPIALSNIEQHSWLGYYATPPPGKPTSHDHGSGQLTDLSEETIELRVSRTIGSGMHEDLDVTNFTRQQASFVFAVEIGADFADLIETTSERRVRGSVAASWTPDDTGGTLRYDFRARHAYEHQGHRGIATLERGLVVRVSCGTPVEHAPGVLRFQLSLDPGASWHACLLFEPIVDGHQRRPTAACYAFWPDSGDFAEPRDRFLRESTRIRSESHVPLAASTVAAFNQARRDLIALRLYGADAGERAWTIAAGVPMYVALFGRDMLTAAWQAGLAGPELMIGTLSALARTQGTTVDDWRDEQPGRILHEAHNGPLEKLWFNPRERYYGSVNSAALYPVVLGELWHWTGHEELLRPFVEPALKSLEWLDEWSDRDRDGFYDYQTQSTQGVKNQGWKDSGDAIVYADGRQVEPPIATVTEQGYVYGGKMLMAEILWWLGDTGRARRLYGEAQDLKRRFNDVFWLDEERYVAMGLDSERRPIRSIGSGGGHAIATGILDGAHVREVADRLMSPDLFSGWGVRTLSAGHPRFNPFSYHRGSVWPAEQGAFALGFFRYGLYDHLERLAQGLIESARLFEHHRLPEVFSGHARDAAHPFPAFYPQTNAPQAWSASAVFCLVQALLGIYPYAPLNMLLVDPHLPEWLPRLTVERLRVGDAVATITFERTAGGTTAYEVTALEGPLHVVRQPSPWSLTSGFGERLKDAFTSLL